MRSLGANQVDEFIEELQKSNSPANVAKKFDLPLVEVKEFDEIINDLQSVRISSCANPNGLRRVLSKAHTVNRRKYTWPSMRWLLPATGLASFALMIGLVVYSVNSRDPLTGYTPAQLSANGTPSHAYNISTATNTLQSNLANQELDAFQFVSSHDGAVNNLGASYGEDEF